MNDKLAVLAAAALEGVNLTSVKTEDSYAYAQLAVKAKQPTHVPALLEQFITGETKEVVTSGNPVFGDTSFTRSTKSTFAPSAKDAYEAALLGLRECGGMGHTDKALYFSKLAKPHDDQSIVDRAGWSLAMLGDSLYKMMGLENAFAYIDMLTANLPETEDQMMSGQIASVLSMAGMAKVDMLVATGDKEGALVLLDEQIETADPRMATRLKSKKNQMTLLGAAAPAIVANEQIGEYASLEDYAGKIVIVDFFAHWCGPCKASFPDMRKLYADLHDKGVEILHVTRYYGYYGSERDLSPEQEFEKMKGFAAEHELAWPVVFVDAEVFTQYGVSGIPHVALIDQDGNVEKIKIGYSAASFAEFRAHIEAMLNSKKN